MAEKQGQYYYTKEEIDESHWRLLGKTVLESDSSEIIVELSETAPAGLIVKAGGQMASGSDAYVDLRAYNGSTILATDSIRMGADGTNLGTSSHSGMGYIAALSSVQQYDRIMFEAFSRKARMDSDWRAWQTQHSRIGATAWTGNTVSTQKNSSEPTSFRLMTDGTFEEGTHLEVWGLD